MNARIDGDAMGAAFDAMFEGCDTIVMTGPSVRLIKGEPRQGFTIFTGLWGDPEFRIFSVDLFGGGDMDESYAEAEKRLAQWIQGHQIVAHVGMAHEVAIDMVQVIWPGDNAVKLATNNPGVDPKSKMH